MSGLASQAFTVLLGRGVIRLSQFLTFLLLVRLMTPEAFGWFGILTTAMALATTLGSLGLRQSFTYQIGQRNLTAGEATGTSILLSPLLTIGAVGVTLAVYSNSDSGIGKTELLALVSVCLAGGILITLLQGVFLGRGEFNWFSVSESAPRVVLLVTVLILAISGSISLSSAMWAYAIGFGATLPFVVWITLRRSDRLGLQIRRLPTMIRYGCIFAINLFLITLCMRISMFVIGQVNGAAAAGEYYAAARVSEIFLEVSIAMGMVVFSNAARQEHDVSIVGRNARIGCWFLWLFMLLAAVVVFAAPWLLMVVAGDQYSNAVPILQILVVGLGPAAASKVIYNTLAGGGRPYFGTVAILLSVVVNSALAVILVPGMGSAGGALAVVIGQYLLYLGYAATCRIKYGVRIREFFIPHRCDLQRISLVVSARIRDRKLRV